MCRNPFVHYQELIEPRAAASPQAPSGCGHCARWVPGFSLDRAMALVAGPVHGPPPQLQALINSVAAGSGLHLISISTNCR